MKKANASITNNGAQARGPEGPKTKRVGNARALPAAPRRGFKGKAVTAILGVVVAASVALLLSRSASVSAQADLPLSLSQNLGSPPFANPSEVRYRAGEKRLRAVMEIISGQYSIPNVGTAPMRQYRGWDPSGPAPNLNGNMIAPGPTLRARLGDVVEISFLNKVDDSIFPYSFDTNSPPGHSSFGCDKSGLTDPRTGTFFPYPYNDLFPNCFHGSSTANIHFHGTHTSPDGVGDNVLVQVLPQPDQPDWAATFNRIFDSGRIPQRWADLPLDYRNRQMEMLRKHDAEAAAQAQKNKLPPPESLWMADQHMIAAGQWPQYLMGAFPNFFKIPDYGTGQYKAGQAPGTHWYHAHKHGSTSLHILNGLAGALVIESSQEGGYDHVIRRYYGWGDSYGDHEKVIVFQQFDPTQNLERPRSTGGKGIFQVLVNGLFQPTITMRPGEVQLWRLLNATEGNNHGKISGELLQDAMKAGFTLKQTAMDGVQFSPDNYKNQPFLDPKAPGGQVPGGLALGGGNRADLLVQAPSKAGTYAFMNTLPNGNQDTLFFVKVTGPPLTQPTGGPFPVKWAEMPAFLRDLPTPTAQQNGERKPSAGPVKFQWEPGRANAGPSGNNPPPHFMINDKQFEEHGSQIDQCMPLNGLQDWALENWTSTPHPFHIHINPFQVVKIETPTAQNKYTTYTPKDNFVWQDVISLPPAVISSDGKQITPGRVTIRQTFVDFVGTFVLHCHILAHEDRGMMELVRVVPANQYPAACQKAIPEHH